MSFLQGQEPGPEPFALPDGPQIEPVTLDDGQHGPSHRCGQRIRYVGGEEQVAELVAAFFDLGAGHHRRQRQSGTERLGQGEDVGYDSVTLEGEHLAGPAESGLRLVQDQQHPAFRALDLQRGQVAGR